MSEAEQPSTITTTTLPAPTSPVRVKYSTKDKVSMVQDVRLEVKEKVREQEMPDDDVNAWQQTAETLANQSKDVDAWQQTAEPIKEAERKGIGKSNKENEADAWQKSNERPKQQPNLKPNRGRRASSGKDRAPSPLPAVWADAQPDETRSPSVPMQPIKKRPSSPEKKPISRQPQPTATVRRRMSSEANDTKLVLWMSNCQGSLSMINDYAQYNQAQAIVHVGNFGFFDHETAKRARLSDLRIIVQEWPSLDASRRHHLLGLTEEALRRAVADLISTSELSSFISGEQRFSVPVYVVPGSFEDVAVIGKVKRGDYHIPNLYLIDQRSSYTIHLGGQKVRLLGLGGALDYERLFTVGPVGSEQTAGSHVEYWPTMMQIGELLGTADQLPPNEIRVLVCSQPMGKEALWSLIARAIGAQYAVGCSSRPGARMACWSDASVHSLESYTLQIASCKNNLSLLWRAVWEASSDRFNEAHLRRIARALRLLEYSPRDEQSLETPWNVQLNVEAQAVMHAGENYLDWECQVREPIRKPTTAAPRDPFNLDSLLAALPQQRASADSVGQGASGNSYGASGNSFGTSGSGFGASGSSRNDNHQSSYSSVPLRLVPTGVYAESYPKEMTPGFLKDEHSVLIFGMPPSVPIGELVEEYFHDFTVRGAKYIMVGPSPRPLVELGSTEEQAKALNELHDRQFRGVRLRLEKKVRRENPVS